MRLTYFITLIILISCNVKEETSTFSNNDSSKTITESIAVSEEELILKDSLPSYKAYANKRFKEVFAEPLGNDSFLVKGKAQIFEANFSWVLEDGHYEILKGNQMTDAGAPEWGKFEFIIYAQKRRKNSTLTLILFESSAMDGSRQHELPITLN